MLSMRTLFALRLLIRWRFATNQQQLGNRLTQPRQVVGLAYQLPSDTLLVHSLTVNDNPIKYDIYGDKAYNNESENSVVVADYTFRADEQTGLRFLH